MPFYPFDRHLPYGFTKHLTEHECLKAHANGLNVVVATSCAIIGPHDYVPSRMGRVLIDYAHGSLRAYIPGGFEFVSSHDIAEGHVLAMRHGRSGQKYIFSTAYASVDDLMTMFREVTRLHCPAAAVAVADGGIGRSSRQDLVPGIPQPAQALHAGCCAFTPDAAPCRSRQGKTGIGLPAHPIVPGSAGSLRRFLAPGLDCPGQINNRSLLNHEPEPANMNNAQTKSPPPAFAEAKNPRQKPAPPAWTRIAGMWWNTTALLKKSK